MTVAELIALLQRCPQNMQVTIDDDVSFYNEPVVALDDGRVQLESSGYQPHGIVITNKQED